MSALNYYNEYEPKTAQWLKQLVHNRDIPLGTVDERSVVDVPIEDLDAYTQCHFFAGIGGWSEALSLAGVDINTSLWTASFPCQPWSVAGNQKGKEDERHLLPKFIELLKEATVRGTAPEYIFGEQVPGAIKLGWLDDLQTELEAEGYTFGMCLLGAHSVSSPHKRQRIFWGARRGGRVGISNSEGLEGHRGLIQEYDKEGWQEQDGHSAKASLSEFYSEQEWVYCKDGKHRAVKSSIQPLVDGVSKRVGHSSDTECKDITPNATQEARTMRLKGYGNAINPLVASVFIQAFMEETR